MIVLYPVLLAVAVAVAVTSRRDGGRGWTWFGCWSLAGALFLFSFLTGLSIGLFVLPAAAAALLLVARRAPHLAEAAGALAGAGAIVACVGLLSWGEGHLAAPAWLATGAAIAAAAAGGYALARRGAA